MSSISLEAKFILDATAGHRMMWHNKQHPNVLYIDKRPEVGPDEVQDFTKLPYPNGSKRYVIWDPPHDVYHKQAKGTFTDNFGALCPETWQSDLQKGFKELWRVLEPGGLLIFKWNTHDVSEKRLLALFPVEPLISQITKQDYSERSKKCHSKTFWMLFLKPFDHAHFKDK